MFQFLSRYSIIGFISGIGSSLLQYIDQIEPIVKVFGFFTGIIIAILTIYAKILEIKNYKKNKKL